MNAFKLISVSLAIAAASILTGCKMDEMFVRKEKVVEAVTAQPAEKITKSERYDPVTGQTNVVWTTNVVSIAITNYSTNIVYEVNTESTRVLGAANTLATQINSVAPNPISTGVAATTTLISGALAWLAGIKSRQANRARAEATKEGDLKDILIESIEAADAKAVKEKVQEISRAWKMEQDMHVAVQRQVNGVK